MNSIHDMVREYSAGCERISRRIVELSEQIAQAYDGGEHKNLVQRRYLLYSELAEMQGSLRELREYLAGRGERLPEEDTAREIVPVAALAAEIWHGRAR